MLHKFNNEAKEAQRGAKQTLQALFEAFGPNHSGIVTFNPKASTYQPAYQLTPPLQTGTLERDNGHSIYYESYGSRSLPTVLLVHGGPGAPVPEYRKLIDVEKNHVLFVHQRGCGQSKPFGKLEGNDTPSLIQDHLAVLDHLKIERFAVQGHSWGGPLGLAIAGTVPDRVDYVLLRGPANGDALGPKRKLEITGPQQFCDYWHALVDEFSKEEKQDLIKTVYTKIVKNDNEEERLRVSRNFSNLNHALSVVQPDWNRQVNQTFEDNLYKLYFHYIHHNFFLGLEKVAEYVRKIKAPVVCVHGRHDRNCYPINSEEIAQNAKNGLVILVEGGGHSPLCKPMINAMIKAQEVLEKEFRHHQKLSQDLKKHKQKITLS